MQSHTVCITSANIQDEVGCLVKEETIAKLPQLTVKVLRVQMRSNDLSSQLVGFKDGNNKTMLLVLDEKVAFRKHALLFSDSNDFSRFLFKHGQDNDKALVRVSLSIGLLLEQHRSAFTV